MVSGELTVRTPEGESVLRAGELACFPPGAAGAHAVRNDSAATARFAMPYGMPSCAVPRTNESIPARDTSSSRS